MYHLLSGIYNEWTRKKQLNILVLGQGSVGKSSLLECIKSEYNRTPSLPIERISKTVGQNVLDVAIPQISTILHFWDLGGEAPLRRLWDQYYEDAQILVWVVDGNDWQDQEPETETEAEKQREKSERRNHDWSILVSILSKPSLQDIPLLLILNKLDDIEAGFPSSSTLPTSVAWFEARLGKSLPGKVQRSRTDSESRIPENAEISTAAGSTTDSAVDSTSHKLGSRSWELVESSALKKIGIKSIVDSLVSFVK